MAFAGFCTKTVSKKNGWYVYRHEIMYCFAIICRSYSDIILYQHTNLIYLLNTSMFSLFFTELRTWFEVPAIAHYCYIFRAAFDLTEFEIEVRAFDLTEFEIEVRAGRVAST